MTKMMMNINFLALIVILAGSAFAVTLEEVQNMKKELEKELSKMQVETNTKRENENEKKPTSEDPRYKEMLEDILKLDVQKSLKSMRTDNALAAEKAASDFLHFLIKADEKHHETPEIEPPFEGLADLKLKNAGHLKDQKTLSKKEAQEAYERLVLEDTIKKEQSSKRDTEYKRVSDILNNASPAEKESDDRCRDVRPDCLRFKLAELCGVKAYEDYMKKKCSFTCKFCYKCLDNLPREKCTLLKKYCHVKRLNLRERMMDYCYVSCGYCKQRSPPACERGEFGCCWDNSTERINPLGTNCPECADKFPSLCKNFKGLCLKKSKPAKFVRKNCPLKCGLCGDWQKGKVCFDNAGYEGLCRKWKIKGYCHVGDIAMNYCKRSCSENCSGKYVEKL